VTAANGETKTCSDTVTVTNPEIACTLTANPTTINKGDSSTLSWTTRGATSFVIDNNIGSVTPIAAGSRSVSPQVTTTYTGTATGPAGTVTCKATIEVPPQPLPPVCTLVASPTQIAPGESSTLTWTTKRAKTVTIDQNIGAVTPLAGGSVSVSPRSTTTYTLTASNDVGTVHCPATVTVTFHPKTICTSLTVDDSSIDEGDSTTLRWTTEHAVKFEIDHGIGSVTPVKEGSISISPDDDTTYTGTATGRDGTTDTCEVSVDVGSSGGGSHHHHEDTPDVSLESTPTQPLSYVYLSQIPYTGLDLGPVGTVIYWLALILWSLALAYLFIFKMLPYLKRRAVSFGRDVHDAVNMDTYPHFDPHASRGHSPDYGHHHDDTVNAHYSQNVEPIVMPYTDAIAPAQSYSTYDGFRSFAAEGVLSIDDIVKGLAREHSVAPVTAPHAFEPIHVAPQAPVAPAPVARMNVEEAATRTAKEVPTDVRGFIAALLEGDRDAAFGTIRNVVRGRGNVQAFLTDAVCALDDAYRARLDGTPADSEVARAVANCPTPTLERLVASLATAVDSSYTLDVTGAKMAVTRAFAALG
jgi:hypothetical protein